MVQRCNRIPIMVAALTCVWGALLWLGVLVDRQVLVSPFDTGVYLDVLTSLSHGRGWAAPMLGESQFLAHHFQPLVALLLPLYWLSPTPTMLFTSSLIALIITLSIAIWCIPPSYRSRYGWVLTILFLTHPALLSRLFASFTPEIFSVPAWSWLAWQLVAMSKEHRSKTPWGLLALAFVVAGFGKETFWITNAWLAGLFWWQSRRPVWLGVAALQFGVFCGLFFWWMPAHTSLPSYYALQFYGASADAGLLNLLVAMVQNIASAQSQMTLLMLVIFTGVMPFAGLNIALWGALPGLAIILTASASQVHHPANHYLIPVLPFLWVAGLVHIKRWQPKFGRLAPIIAALGATFGIGLTLLFPGGALDKFALTQKLASMASSRRHDALAFVQQYVAPTALLVADGLFQPLVTPIHQPTVVLLGFTGNPYRLDLRNLTSAFYVLTSANLHQIDDCAAVKVGGQHLDVDYPYFVKMCRFIKDHGKVVREYQNGVIGFVVTPPQATPHD